MESGRYDFYAFVWRMKYINRWGLMRNTHDETIEGHSLQTAVIAHALAVIKNVYFGGSVDADRCAAAALFHDASEIMTGDMPTPVKYANPEINLAYKRLEDVSREKLLSMLPSEMEPVYRELMFFEKDEGIRGIVKAADKIAAYIKCLEERRAGNSEFNRAGEAILKSIEAMDIPEAKWFMEHFLPSFALSLDELG